MSKGVFFEILAIAKLLQTIQIHIPYDSCNSYLQEHRQIRKKPTSRRDL
jgi:hypothetical protein